VTVQHGFRPAQKHTSGGLYQVVTDTFDVLVAKKRKPENPLRQIWSVALPAAGRKSNHDIYSGPFLFKFFLNQE
jgi:hypothetical protein